MRQSQLPFSLQACGRPQTDRRGARRPRPSPFDEDEEHSQQGRYGSVRKPPPEFSRKAGGGGPSQTRSTIRPVTIRQIARVHAESGMVEGSEPDHLQQQQQRRPLFMDGAEVMLVTVVGRIVQPPIGTVVVSTSPPLQGAEGQMPALQVVLTDGTGTIVASQYDPIECTLVDDPCGNDSTVTAAEDFLGGQRLHSLDEVLAMISVGSLVSVTGRFGGRAFGSTSSVDAPLVITGWIRPLADWNALTFHLLSAIETTARLRQHFAQGSMIGAAGSTMPPRSSYEPPQQTVPSPHQQFHLPAPKKVHTISSNQAEEGAAFPHQKHNQQGPPPASQSFFPTALLSASSSTSSSGGNAHPRDIILNVLRSAAGTPSDAAQAVDEGMTTHDIVQAVLSSLPNCTRKRAEAELLALAEEGTLLNTSDDDHFVIG